MTCDCGSKMTSAREIVKYDASGLPVTLVNVEVRRCPKCGDFEVVIPKIEHLHALLAAAVISKASPLAPVEVRFLRKYLGWSGVDFAQHMGTTAETVSRWENGKLQMAATADRLLRTMVAVKAPVANYSLDVLRSIKPRKDAKPLRVGVTLSPSGWKTEKVA